MSDKRLTYFDEMRGLAIIAVVMTHVCWLSLGNYNPLLKSAIVMLFAPLFFAVSGYFSYQNIAKEEDLKQYIINRSARILIPLAVWSIIYMIIYRIEPLEFCRKNFYGYWYFEILWILTAIFCIISFIESLLPKKRFTVICLIILFYIPMVILYRLYPDYTPYVSTIDLYDYYPIFAFGYLIKRYPRFDRIILSNVAAAIGFIFYIIIIPYHRYGGITLQLTGGICITIALWHFFRSNSGIKWINRTLAYLGRITLPIYVLQFFFLPDLKAWFDGYSWIAQSLGLQALLSLFISCVVIAVSVLVYKLLNNLGIISDILFGRIKITNHIANKTKTRYGK